MRPGTSSCVWMARTPAQRERRGEVDRSDPRVGVGAAHRGPPQHSVRPEVRRVRELALDLQPAVGAVHALADAVADPRGPDLGRAGAAHETARPRGHPHGVEDLLVAGAATEVAGQRLADLGRRSARGCGRAGRGSPRSGPACRSRTAPRPPRGRPPGSDPAHPRTAPGPRRSRSRRPRPVPRARGTSTRASRPGTPSTSRTRPARRRSSSPAGPSARAARTAGSHPPRRRRSAGARG